MRIRSMHVSATFMAAALFAGAAWYAMPHGNAIGAPIAATLVLAIGFGWGLFQKFDAFVTETSQTLQFHTHINSMHEASASAEKTIAEIATRDMNVALTSKRRVSEMMEDVGAAQTTMQQTASQLAERTEKLMSAADMALVESAAH
ncbi:MAG TPA: hypothetical protein VHP37_22245 [Burkholderiales bacterium]|nr:hypothetical protein [Burkholderiales bacterium]